MTLGMSNRSSYNPVRNRMPDAPPIASRNSFDSRDNYYDKVEYFMDPDYWGQYNIIEPTESLDKAIQRLVSTYRRN